MSQKNCYHCMCYEGCTERNLPDKIPEVVTETHCPYFKDRARFLELPCNIGDPVYIIVKLRGGAPGHIMKKTCTGIHITEKVFGGRAERANYYLVVNSSIGTAQHIPFTQFGKIVFFNEAEAKAAFEKMRREHDERST